MSPPLRTENDRQALVAAVASGLIDVIMSDHNPQDVEIKRLPFAEAAAGAIGLETMLSAGLRLVHNGELELADPDPRDVDAAGGIAQPARRHAARGQPGRSDRDRSPTCPGWSIPTELKSKCKNTPFDEAQILRPGRPHHCRRPHGV